MVDRKQKEKKRMEAFKAMPPVTHFLQIVSTS
jgi:hypothetical protein